MNSNSPNPLGSNIATHALNGEVVCVDLDGTLIKTDLLWESLLALMRHAPFLLFLVPFWLLKGRANLKRQITKRVLVDAALLPYREDVLTLLRRLRGEGKKLILATASDLTLAINVNDHLRLFDTVLASDGVTNLKGRIKRDVLVKLFGKGGYSYIGDSRADLSIWETSKDGVVVTSSTALFGAAKKLNANLMQIVTKPASIPILVKAFRMHQWVKNFLLFVPLVLAHKIFDEGSLSTTTVGFISFCLVASGVYVLNDLVDIESDRKHATKRNRPFASAALSIPFGLVLTPLLFAIGFCLAMTLPGNFIWALALYVLITMLYSFYVKALALVDIVFLAALYSIRLLAGGEAAQVVVSQWLLAFSMFFFFSLACVKRYSELYGLRASNGEKAAGRGYHSGDLEVIGVLGSCSALLSILVMALYVSSAEVIILYRHPTVLWLLCPIFLYWSSRVWLLAHRGEIHEDPVVFALTDKVSYLVGLLALAVVVLGV